MRSERRIFWALVFVLAAGLLASTAEAHDPKRRVRRPTRAAGAIRDARRRMDEAKRKIAEAGKYDCCIKPSCDLCASAGGMCDCAASVKAGRGACGECLEGWAAGIGRVKGVKAGDIGLRHHHSRPVEEELKRIEEIVAARDSLNEAKRTLAGEGRYACCISGGCDSCAHGTDCDCGASLIAAPAAAEKNRKKGEGGVCGECLDGWHAGRGSFAGVALDEIRLEEMDSGMASSFGVGTIFRQGSGTSWLPEATPMYALMAEAGSWMMMFHAQAFSTYSYQSGPRGGREFFSTNFLMASAQREVKGFGGDRRGMLLLRGMFSFDALTAGGDGYPLLFQTGETFNGRRLLDRQHPHDLVMELSAAYSAQIGEETSVTAYLAAMGEPALGPPAFMHRLSAFENPEAPLGHHWQDSTHISAGVVTLGVAREKWKVEGSLFSGREPDERRWNFETPRMDSWSARVSFNPAERWSGQVSYGRLREPDALEPDVNVRRWTASLTYHQPLGERSYVATSFVWGRNTKSGGTLVRRYMTDAILVESTFSIRDRASLFGRYEMVEKDELFSDGEHTHDPLIFNIHRHTIGGVYNLPLGDWIGFDLGIGSSVSLHRMPADLKLFYGARPVSATVFLRVRPKRWGWRD